MKELLHDVVWNVGSLLRLLIQEFAVGEIYGCPVRIQVVLFNVFVGTHKGVRK
jgi:hypothetical protein